MRRIKVTLSYDGTDFHGWQIQPGLPTIQEAVERVVAEIEGAPVRVTGSGRTDAGVHALAQVAAFSLRNPIPTDNLRRAMNRLLPAEIRILAAEETAPEFHPMRDAIAKTYEYRIFRAEVCPPFERRYLHHYPYPLNVDRMAEAAPLFEGEHDFTSFAASDKSDELGRSKVRAIFSSSIECFADRIVYRVRGGGFLKHMVRNIAGTLIEAGKENLGVKELTVLLRGDAGVKAGPTVPPNGLFLIGVEY
ncbi:MAG: tRNA pseudouridine(38-40) synthase TruA [Bryobacteraceae bacterium]|nr:tRNA pseudouridine(38-40) synthase TruA [Bryobacteraceae bacterium]